MQEHYEEAEKIPLDDPFEDIDTRSAADITDLLDQDDIDDLVVFNRLHEIARKNAQEKIKTRWVSNRYTCQKTQMEHGQIAYTDEKPTS